MHEKPDVLKRLEEIETRCTEQGFRPEDVGWVLTLDDADWLLRLTRALLESQGELLEELGGHACCRAPHNRCAACEALDRAERVRKGEV